MLERIEKYINLIAVKEDVRKIGVNLITAGVVGMFITSHAAINQWTISLSSLAVTVAGIAAFYFGWRKEAL